MKKFLTKYQTVIGFINYAIAFVVLFAAYMPDHVFRIAFTTWLIAWLIEGRWLSLKNFSFDRTKYPLIGLALYIAFRALSVLWSVNAEAGSREVSHELMPLFVLPVALWGVNEHYKVKPLIYTFIISGLVAGLMYYFALSCVFNSDYIHAVSGAKWHAPDLEWLMVFINPLKHHHYLGVLYLCAIFAMITIRKYLVRSFGKRMAVLAIVAACAVLSFHIFWSGSRTCMLVLAAVLCISLVRYKENARIPIAIGSILIVAASIFAVLSLHPRGGVAEDGNFEQSNGDVAIQEPRMLIWQSCLAIIPDNLWFGSGAGSARKLLQDYYDEHNILAQMPYGPAVTPSRSPHNQYLAATIETGIFSCLFLVVLLCLSFRCFSGRARTFTLYFSLVYLFSMTFESMLERNCGLMIYCLMMLLALWLQREDTPTLSDHTTSK